MMKRALTLMLALVLLAAAVPCAGAEQGKDEMPYGLKTALKNSVFAGDEVLDWIVRNDLDDFGLAAVRHEGQMVLLGYMEGVRGVQVLSESVLPTDGSFALEYHKHGDKPTLSIVHEGQCICLMPLLPSDGWLPYLYHTTRADGSAWYLGLFDLPEELPCLRKTEGGQLVREGVLDITLPGDVAFMTFDMFPQSPEETAHGVMVSSLPEGKTYGVSSRCNFRALPDVRSASRGYCNAGTVVELLGVRAFNWQMVCLGGMIGWMHKDYVLPSEHLCGYALPAARVERQTPLTSSEGEVIATLQPGDAAHVISALDSGYAHAEKLYVCMPRSEIGMVMDVDGTFGYVAADAVRVFSNALNLKYDGY